MKKFHHEKGVTLTISDIDLGMTWEIDDLVSLGHLVGGLVVDEDSRGACALEEAIEHRLVLGMAEEFLISIIVSIQRLKSDPKLKD